MYRRTDICTSRHPIDQVLILYLSEIKEKLRNNIISEIGQINCRKCAFLLIVNCGDDRTVSYNIIKIPAGRS